MEDKALLNELLYKLSGFSTTAKKSKDKVKVSCIPCLITFMVRQLHECCYITSDNH